MKQMKKYLFLFIAFLGILFSGCEKDTYGSPSNSKENKLKVRDVSLKMIPQIEEELDSVKEFLKTKSIQNRTIYDFNLNEEQIKELQLANGDVNYSFIVEKQLAENTAYYFENLEITLKNSGFEAYVMKWIPADGNVFAGLDKFTGELQYQDLDGRILQSVQLVDGLLTQSKLIAITIGCWDYVIQDMNGTATIISSYNHCGSGSTSGGSSNGSSTGTTSGTSGTVGYGDFSGVNFNNSPHSPSDQGYYVVYNGPSDAPAIPTNDEVERVKCQAFLNTLNTTQYNYLGTNPAISSQLFSYLIENWFTLPSRKFMKEVITKMIAKPSVFISIKPFLIEKQLNTDNLDTCTKDILNKLKSNSKIAEIIARFDNPDSVFTLILNQAVITPNPANPNSVIYGQTTNSNTNYLYNITLNSNYYNDSGATNLGKAKTIIHEILHALILSVIENGTALNNDDAINFPLIWNAYINKKFNGDTNATHHLFIGNNYIKIIAEALQEYDTGVPVIQGQIPEQMYSDLAWSGLFALLNPTSPFDSILTNTDKARIYNRNNTEMNRSNAFGMTPSSNNPCLN